MPCCISDGDCNPLNSATVSSFLCYIFPVMFSASWLQSPLVCSLTLLMSIVALAQSSFDVERHLRDRYDGNILLVRNFYTVSPRTFGEDSITYDETGHVSEDASSGDWTLYGAVEIGEVHVSDHRLIIDGKRLPVALNGPEGLGFPQRGRKNHEKKKGRPVRISVDFGPEEITAEKVDVALSQIFLNSRDRLAMLVPDYWGACVEAATTGKNAQELPTCRFSPEFLAVPGVVAPERALQAPVTASSDKFTAAELELARHETGVSPPRVIRQIDPAISQAECPVHFGSGSIALMLLVDKAGKARNVQIIRPLGCGIDRQAVETVANWEFTPAMKDGRPVDAEIRVDVAFRIY